MITNQEKELITKANHHYYLGAYAQALRTFEEALASNPQNKVLYQVIEANRGRLPQDVLLYLLRAYTFAAESDLGSTNENLKKAISAANGAGITLPSAEIVLSAFTGPSDQQVQVNKVLRFVFGKNMNEKTYNLVRDTGCVITAMDNLFTLLSLVDSAKSMREYSKLAANFSSLMERFARVIPPGEFVPVTQDTTIRNSAIQNHYPFRLFVNQSFLENASKIPLRISAFSYGSRMSIDFLGSSKILEFIEYGMNWRMGKGDYEKAKAFLEGQILPATVSEAGNESGPKELEPLGENIEMIAAIRQLELPLVKKKELVTSLMNEIEQVAALPNVEEVYIID